MSGAYRINPRIRAYGKARIDVTQRAKDEQEWQSLWKAPAHPYPFSPGTGWKFCIEYQVDDYAAEIGFLIDFLGFSVYSFSPNYAQFTSPEQDFLFGVSATQPGERSTPPDTLRLQFKVKDLLASVQELEQRGILFEQSPMPVQEGARLYIAIFRTPHGIPVDLWGEVESLPAVPVSESGLNETDPDRIQPQIDEGQQPPVANEEEVEAEEAPEADQDESDDQDESGDQKGEDIPGSDERQTGFWTQVSKSVSSLRDKSSRIATSGHESGTKRTPGNGEVTYAPIEEDDGDIEDSDNEEYP